MCGIRVVMVVIMVVIMGGIVEIVVVMAEIMLAVVLATVSGTKGRSLRLRRWYQFVNGGAGVPGGVEEFRYFYIR